MGIFVSNINGESSQVGGEDQSDRPIERREECADVQAAIEIVDEHNIRLAVDMQGGEEAEGEEGALAGLVHRDEAGADELKIELKGDGSAVPVSIVTNILSNLFNNQTAEVRNYLSEVLLERPVSIWIVQPELG